MAKIKGYELKAIKTFTGMEGLGFEANLYSKNKKIGRVLDDASGGPLQTFIEDKEKERQFEEDTKNWGEELGKDSFMIDEIFIDELFTLKEKERIFKQAQKEGYKGIVVLTDRYKEDLFSPRRLDEFYNIPEQCTDGDVEQGEYDKKEYYVKLDDFNIA